VTDPTQNGLDLKLYPNPTQDFIAIQSNLLDKTLELKLHNELGQVVLESVIFAGSTLSILETHTLYNGIYFLNVYYKKQQRTYKIIIDK
jgi:hypothetical protein